MSGGKDKVLTDSNAGGDGSVSECGTCNTSCSESQLAEHRERHTPNLYKCFKGCTEWYYPSQKPLNEHFVHFHNSDPCPITVDDENTRGGFKRARQRDSPDDASAGQSGDAGGRKGSGQAAGGKSAPTKRRRQASEQSEDDGDEEADSEGDDEQEEEGDDDAEGDTGGEEEVVDDDVEDNDNDVDEGDEEVGVDDDDDDDEDDDDDYEGGSGKTRAKGAANVKCDKCPFRTSTPRGLKIHQHTCKGDT